MKTIVVYGANGKIGSRVVSRLLAKKYKVVAFIRGQHQFAPHKNLKIIKGDIYNADQIATAMQGRDAVMSTLGSWGTPKKDIISTGMRHILPAMEAQGIKRIVTLTGADSRCPNDKPLQYQKAMHRMLGLIAPKILQDGEKHMELLRKSTTEWTTLRSPVMVDDGPANYELRYTLTQPWNTIPRDAVAEAMVWLIETNQYVRCEPLIYR